jgi:hypothetical protein
MIKLKKYYIYYNEKEDLYYLDKSYPYKKSHKYCGNQKKGNAIASAFRAINLANQNVPADTFVKVLFQLEKFDLANEYNPVNSTFISKKAGVYSILGTISFSPNNPNIDYRARIEIRINGNPAVAIDNDFFGGGVNFANAVNVSTILQLEAGDRVEIFAESSVDGTILTDTDGVISTHFEAARFPSPTR